MKRKLISLELEAIRSLASVLMAPERDQLMHDINQADVEEVTPDGSRIQFHIDGYARPAYRGQHLFASEGTVRDGDGARVDVVLHADENNRVLELELIKWGEAPIVGVDWSSFAPR